MIQNIKWEATKRKEMTKGELKIQKAAGLVPAIITRRGEDSISIFVNHMDLVKRPSGNFRIELKVKGIGEPFDCFLKELQHDYVANTIIHADFQGLTVGEELDIDVPFELVGTAPGVKAGGILNTSITSCKIRTLPKNIPGTIQIDVSELQIGDSINITDVKFAAEHTLVEPLEGSIVSMIDKRKEEEETEEASEIAEPEIITEKAAE
ncbi:MAG: 50S ribosomal protein L25 [Denitrovibrio sp.]|nr:MAG: 50S ribosomal protein L25 [Denitrovibrio sp.]